MDAFFRTRSIIYHEKIAIKLCEHAHVVDFFNAFLKNEKNPFKSCTSLTRNTYMECGPGIF